MKRLLILAFLFVAPVQAAITLHTPVWTGHLANAVNGSCAGTISATGDTVIVLIGSESATAPSSVVSTLGNSVVNVMPWQEYSTHGAYQGVYEVKGATVAGSETITVSFATATYASVICADYSGISTTASVQVATIGGANNSSAPSVGPLTPTTSGMLAVTLLSSAGATFSVSAWGNGFTQEGSETLAPSTFYADQILANTNPISASATLGAAEYTAMSLLLFSPTGGGGSSCTHAGWGQGGPSSVPNGTSGLYWGKSGAWVTPDCSMVYYWAPATGNFVVN